MTKCCRDSPALEIQFPREQGGFIIINSWRVPTGARYLSGRPHWMRVGVWASPPERPHSIQDPLPGGSGLPSRVISLGQRGRRGAARLRPRCGSRSQRLYLQGGEFSLPQRPSPAQRRLRGPGRHGRLHFFRRPATQFPRFLR